MRINEPLNGVELRFSEKPDQAVLDLLTEQEWRFNKDGWKDPRWYKKRSAKAEALASKIVQLCNDEASEEPAPEPVEEAPVNRCEPAPVSNERVTIAIPATTKAGGKKTFW